MERFWAWIAGQIGDHHAFSLRVWTHNWRKLVLGALVFFAVLAIIWPVFFETRTPEGYEIGSVKSSFTVPVDDSPPVAGFVVQLPAGEVIELRTSNLRLASTITDTACVARSRGQSTGIERFALFPMGFCEPDN